MENLYQERSFKIEEMHQITKDKTLIVLAKIHVIIMILTLCGGIIGKILRLDMFRIIAGFYFIFGNVVYVFIFNVLNEKKLTATKTTSGFHNKIYYFINTITSLIIVFNDKKVDIIKLKDEDLNFIANNEESICERKRK